MNSGTTGACRSRRRLKDWTAAIRFFSNVHHFIDNQRDMYGGHVHDGVARYILSCVEPTDESRGVIELKCSDDNTLHLVFQFAEALVTTALFVDRGERDKDEEESLHDGCHILMDAVSHAGRATQIAYGKIHLRAHEELRDSLARG